MYSTVMSPSSVPFSSSVNVAIRFSFDLSGGDIGVVTQVRTSVGDQRIDTFFLPTQHARRDVLRAGIEKFPRLTESHGNVRRPKSSRE